ncbi:MAG: hypothetical protein AAF986_05035 [Pseudomonadota bacterium]
MKFKDLIVMLRPALLPAIVGFSLLAACATESGADGPFYPAGFTDGCRSGEASQASFSDKVYRDKQLFKDEQSYRAGWRSGFAQCSRIEDLDQRPGDLGEREAY